MTGPGSACINPRRMFVRPVIQAARYMLTERITGSVGFDRFAVM
jgi:hypothetical protein